MRENENVPCLPAINVLNHRGESRRKNKSKEKVRDAVTKSVRFSFTYE